MRNINFLKFLLAGLWFVLLASPLIIIVNIAHGNWWGVALPTVMWVVALAQQYDVSQDIAEAKRARHDLDPWQVR